MSSIPQNSFAAAAIWIDDQSEPALLAPGNFIVVADDAVQEDAKLKSLNLRAGSTAFGLFSHVVPALLCHADGLARPARAPSLKRYAILCLPRSGSRYLTAKLSEAGVGAPLEHLREPLATAITNGKLGFASSIKALERFGQTNGIFGTKLISTFLIDASGENLSSLKRNIGWMLKRGYQFIYLERPLQDAVVSSYIAFRLKKWHFFSEMNPGIRDKLDALPFEEGAVWDEYIRFLADKIIIEHISRSCEMTSFEYATVRDRVNDIVAWLCHRMQTDLKTLKRGFAPIPIPTRDQSATYTVFTERLSALLEHRGGELEGRTIKRLCERTALKRKAAEKLVAAQSDARFT